MIIYSPKKDDDVLETKSKRTGSVNWDDCVHTFPVLGLFVNMYAAPLLPRLGTCGGTHGHQKTKKRKHPQYLRYQRVEFACTNGDDLGVGRG